MAEMSLQAKFKWADKRTTDSDHDGPRFPNLLGELRVVFPDQVWMADITYIRLVRGFVYLDMVMDVFTAP